MQNEIDAGRLTPELGSDRTAQKYLTQSVGYHGTVDPVTSTRPVNPGDVFSSLLRRINRLLWMMSSVGKFNGDHGI